MKTALMLILAIGLTASAQAPLVTITDLTTARQFAVNIRPALSPDGALVAYTVIEQSRDGAASGKVIESVRSAVPVNAAGGHILLTSVATGETRSATSDEASSWGGVWSPDGRRLAFTSTAQSDGRPRLWVWDRATERARAIGIDAVRGDLEWTPDGTHVLTQLLPGVEPRQTTATVPSGGARPGVTATVFRHDPTPTRVTAPSTETRLVNAQGTLALVSLESGRARPLLSNEPIAARFLSPDGKEVLVTALRGAARTGSFQRVYDVLIVSALTGARRSLATGITLVRDDAARWSPDGSRVAYKTPEGVVIVAAADGTRVSSSAHDIGWGIDRDNRAPVWDSGGSHVYYTTDNRTLWMLAASSNQPVKLADFADSFVEIIANTDSPAWAPQGAGSVGVYVHSFAANLSSLQAVTSAGRVTRLLQTNRSLGSANVPMGMTTAADGTLIYISESAHEPQDLWIADRSFKSDRRLTFLNPQLDRLSFGRSRIVEWRNARGEPLRGGLLLPPDYRAGERYPLIVWVYGGVRQSRDANRFGMGRTAMYNQQMLATRGYAVFLPDSPPRPGDPIGALVDNVLSGVDRVVAEGYADPERVALAGVSYGGYSSLALLTRTNRFKAGVAISGLYNLTSMYLQLGADGSSPGVGMADTGRLFIDGTLWDNRDAFVENSPVFHLNKMATPLLLMHGDADLATPHTESEQVFVGLRRLGKVVEYVRYGGEGHGITSVANQDDY
ncbi:MAG TPA: prolyl oligopeptidase family serine peptidase, partial [Vicinamibacterales bacterium]|nr:prolyl oligopeptidase family serine peptidase [Vicinamibacterales bacterium]